MSAAQYTDRENDCLNGELPEPRSRDIDFGRMLELECAYQIDRPVDEKAQTLADLLVALKSASVGALAGLQKICGYERAAGMRSRGGLAWVARVQNEVAAVISGMRTLDDLSLRASGDEVSCLALQIKIWTAPDEEVQRGYAESVSPVGATVFLAELRRRNLKPIAHPDPLKAFG